MIKIRYFRETNSSSSHSLVFCKGNEKVYGIKEHRKLIKEYDENKPVLLNLADYVSLQAKENLSAAYFSEFCKSVNIREFKYTYIPILKWNIVGDEYAKYLFFANVYNIIKRENDKAIFMMKGDGATYGINEEKIVKNHIIEALDRSEKALVTHNYKYVFLYMSVKGIYFNSPLFIRYMIDNQYCDKKSGLFPPVQVDIKVTDSCDMACPFCHESSTAKGKHADLRVIKNFFDYNSNIAEVAIGGGNPLAFPFIVELTYHLESMRIFPSLTIHADHFLSCDFLHRFPMCTAFGISIPFNSDQSKIDSIIRKIVENKEKEESMLSDYTNRNYVLHFINRVHTTDQILYTIQKIEEINSNDVPILILGYKEYGRGLKFKKKEDVDIAKIINTVEQNRSVAIIFDSLAVDQLKVKDVIDSETFFLHHQGDDRDYSRYIDFVKGEWAFSSYDLHRFPLSTFFAERTEGI